MGIMSIDKLTDSLAQFLHATEDSSVEGTTLEACKPTLNGVQPRGARGREVQLHAGVLGKPGFDLGGLVRGTVVEDDMQVQCRGRRLVDLAHEVEELTGSVASCDAPH